MDPRDDADLLRGWRNGDREAGLMLVTRHYDAVSRFFATKVGADADDLVQRVFLRVSEGASRYAGEGSVRAFVFGIARNVLFEHLRGRVRDGRVSPDFRESAIADLVPGVSTVAAQRAEQRLLLRALQQIPVESQVLLELYYWEEFSLDELASTLGVAAGTVKSRLHRARAALRETILELPPDDGEEASVRVLVANWIAGLGTGTEDDATEIPRGM